MRAVGLDTGTSRQLAVSMFAALCYSSHTAAKILHSRCRPNVHAGSPAENQFCTLCFLRRPRAVLCVPVLWPTLSHDSYVRWRTPALAAMRLALMAMPFQYSTRVVNALAAVLATGRFAGLLNAYALLNGGCFSRTHVSPLCMHPALHYTGRQAAGSS